MVEITSIEVRSQDEESSSTKDHTMLRALRQSLYQKGTKKAIQGLLVKKSFGPSQINHRKPWRLTTNHVSSFENTHRDTQVQKA